jgi:hypothetical protein
MKKVTEIGQKICDKTIAFASIAQKKASIQSNWHKKLAN